MAKNDIEKVEQEILSIIQSNFAAKIAEINTDKKDTLLEEIDDTNYFTDFFQGEITESLFIFHGITAAEAVSVGRDSAETWTIFYFIFINDPNNLSKIRSRVLRYTRALKEIINENAAKIARFCSKGEISSLTPLDMESINEETPFKMGGIEFQVTLS